MTRVNNPRAGTPQVMSRGDVTSTDGVPLRIYESGVPGAPTVVCLHGYPDDHTMWDGVAAELAPRYHLVRYDVRGAGESGKPRDRRAYRLAQLAQDLVAVVDAVSTDRPVHLSICWPTTGARPRPGMR
jgi:pimeloyl-ACP methyl ester carboxylesterase